MVKLKIGMCQMMTVKTSKMDNIKKAKEIMEKAILQGAEIVVLPEMFNCPYNIKHFREYSEQFPNGDTIRMLSNVARDNSVYVVGGSIPELDKDRVYNTCFVFDDKGNMIGKHRKAHLFDVDIKGKVKFKESQVLSHGDKATIIDTKWGKIGVEICYDIRFPELMRTMAMNGAKIVFVPASFNMTTGPAHWEILFKSRALDNQIYIVGVSPARNTSYSYVSYGNSLIVNPWGEITHRLDEKENVLVGEIDLDYIDEVRKSLPLLKHLRPEVYNNVE
ncbi:carbon-nitrogen hydrolase family protein [Clostridium fermenticellae]|uniref:Carbon-nitrogen hydrolase family protein n=1 Tax=Clostridium fermenticellae TaxID=2068654 RepID=A0A386H3P4_9CLOT|nr:carbon-nitrogen hydrolase family protein [Clostridium fermenticellae]AYD40312.1 carbon-nitrogen hydrolase family protein [Clostridium fermenticellae]